MKKLFVVIIMFIIILSGVKTETNFSLLDYFSGEYTAYTEQNSSNGINLGFCYMNSNQNVEALIGESLVVKNLEIGSALSTLKAKVVKTEYLENDMIVIYAFSPLIDEKVKVFNTYVNLQIATSDDRSVIGWPLIMGSF